MVHREQVPRGVVFVESGVFFANTSAALLEAFSAALPAVLAEVHLVDPWDGNDVMQEALEWYNKPTDLVGAQIIAEVRHKLAGIPGVGLCTDSAREFTDGGFVLDAASCCRGNAWAGGMAHAAALPDRCVPVLLHQATGVEVADYRFMPSSVDVVFVDGSHSFQDVHEDLEAWWQRIRPGGILVGHDFTWEHPDVPAAVLSFLTRISGNSEMPELYLDVDSVFWFRKPTWAEPKASMMLQL